jgi:hypothetical protein
MLTMIDQIFDRQYRAARTELNLVLADGLSRAARAFLKSFEVLNRVEYSAPWTAQRKRTRAC